MPPDDDDLMAEFDAEAQAQAPRMRQTVRTVLDPVDVVGSPDGTGTSTMGEGGQYVFGEEVDANAPIADAPKGPATPPSPEVGAHLEERARRIQLARETTPTGMADAMLSPVWDAMVAGPMSVPGNSGARRRTGERLSQLWDEFTASDARLGGRNRLEPIYGTDERPNAAATGAAGALSLGFADEGAGLAEAARGGSYRDGQRRADAQMARAREQAPGMYTVGTVAGTAPLAAGGALLPGAAAAGVPGALARTGWAAAEGAVAGLGNSGNDLIGEGANRGGAAWDAGRGALLAGGMAGAGELTGAALGAIRRGPQTTAQARDEALLAATGHAGNNSQAVREFDFGDTPSQIAANRARAAQVLRDTGAVPRFGGMRRTAQQIDQAIQANRQVMDDVRTAMGGRGPTGRQVAERLRAQAADARAVTAEPARHALSDFAERYGDDVLEGARRSDEPIDYDALMAELEGLRSMGTWRTRAGRDVSLREGAGRIIDRELRGAYDDEIAAQLMGRGERGAYRGGTMSHEQTQAAERLGADPVEAYRASRQRDAVLRHAGTNAQRGLDSIAGNRGVGMSEMQWGAAGSTAGGSVGLSVGGPGGALIGTAAGAALGGTAARAWRGVEPRVRATVADGMYRMAQRYPRQLMERLPFEAAQRLSQSASRGPAAFATALHVLAQRDAEVRRLMQEFDSMSDEESTPEAIRAIGASGEMQ